MTPQQRLADAFVALAGSASDEPPDVSTTLSVLVDHAPGLLGTRAAAALFSPDTREALQVAGSDPDVGRLAKDAAGWREGPGHDCHRGLALPARIALGNLPVRQRWPHYVQRALRLGYTYVTALPLRGPVKVDGALVLLSDRHDAPSPEMLALGQSMADFTAVTLWRTREADRSRALTAQLESALTSRIVIEQAKGVLSGRRSLTMDEAFDVLRNHARSHQRRLSDVSREVVDGQRDQSDQSG
ncbi:ANTAR domain-containing protein [Streptomyces sp. NPDC046465]|uniref:ANTAR domain-containing protein n=1 Tax=Streptomyces sp. NPDC046465 TaxID=3155810 RepID=UPI00340DB0E9